MLAYRPTSSLRTSKASPAAQHKLPITIADVARKRRVRVPTGAAKTPKYVVEQARRRAQAKTGSLRFQVAAPSPAPVAPSQAQAPELQESPQHVHLPFKLGRPDYRDVSPKALLAAGIEPGLPIEHVRDGLEVFGPSMLRSMATVQGKPTKDAIPEMLTITMQDSSMPPTHMVAVHGRHVPEVPLKVTIYPVHALVFASYCTRLPPFSPSAPPPPGAVEYTVPVHRMPLPSPENYFRLSAYLYSKNARMLFCSLMPQRPPEFIFDTIGKSKARKEDVIEFGTKLSETYTPKALFSFAMNVHGLWQNVCALGIFDDALWEVMDLAYWVLLAGLSISTGAPLDKLDPDN